MCPLIDVGDTCQVVRIASKFGNQDYQWLGCTGMVSEVMRPFFLLELPDGRWTVRFEEELWRLPDDGRDRADAEDAPGEIAPGAIPAHDGTGDRPGEGNDSPGTTGLDDPLEHSHF